MTTLNDRPVPFITIWAEEGIVSKTIPELQADRETTKDENGKPLNSARATMQEGFPAITMKSAMRGGVPPWGQDHNKILNQITDAIRWMQAGGCAFFNQTLCSKISGYPKGAMLQGKKDGEVPILWFSVIDNNNSDPDVTISPNNGWVKLDFADLEKRLKAAEDHIVIIDGRLDSHDIHLGTIDGRLDGHDMYLNAIDGRLGSHDIHLGTIDDRLDSHDNKINTNQSNISKNTSDIRVLHETKAELEGSCDTPFHAKTMKAGEYRFCNSLEGQGSYITQAGNSMDFHGEGAFIFHFDDMNKNPVEKTDDGVIKNENPDRAILLTCYHDGKQYLSGCNLSTTNVVFDGGWTTLRSPFTIENQEIIHESFKNTIAWVQTIKNDDYVITLYPKGFKKKEEPDYVKPDTFLTMSASDYSVKANMGAFKNSDSDLAEYYQADRTDYKPGSLMCHGVDAEVTLCKNIDQSDSFFGIISTRPGYVMNSDIEKDPNAVLIALNGKVPVKVKGVVRCGDKITVGQNGYGVVSKNKNDVIVGRAKEDKITEEVGLVSCYVQAHI